MEDLTKSSLLIYLSSIEDPRPGNNIQHNFTEILFIAVCAVICGCESWTDMEDYAGAKYTWFKTFLCLKNGVPSHDTFRRIFCILNFEVFQSVFTEWTEEVRVKLNIKKDQICIDGKTLRGTLNKNKSLKALHMVNAWSKKASINLGQVCVDKKSNEITAIPKLLDMLTLKGCLVSIDAMGCQRNIAEKVVEKGGDFLLALKGNQSGLLEATEEVFRRASTARVMPVEKKSYIEKERNSHGRDTTRSCVVLALKKDQEIGFFPHLEWPLVSSLIQIKSERINLCTGEISNETRYYISSSDASAKYFNESVRSHWEVENKLHWSLDVAMREDEDHRWAEESAKNLSLLRQYSHNLIKKYPLKRGVKRKQKLALMDNDFLLKLWSNHAGYSPYA